MRRSGRAMGLGQCLRGTAMIGLGLLALACDDDGGGNARIGDATTDVGVLADLGEQDQGGAGGQGAAGGEGGMGAAGGMGGMGAAGGGGPGIRDIESCPEICAVYEEECGRLGDLWGGSFAACQTACEEGSTNERFPAYLGCMQVTACDALQDCVVPQRPLPPCADVCAAAAACDDDFRLPAGFAEFADCPAACADGTAARQLAACGVALVDDGVCAEPAFARCVLQARARNCLEICDFRAACDAGLDAVDCAIACSQPIDDALAALKADQRRTCVRQAGGDCAAIAACDAATPDAVTGVAELCAADAAGACPFFEAATCEADATRALRGRGAEGAACLTAGIEACAEPVYACFNSPAAPNNACSDHCRYSELCGQLEAGQTEFDCLEGCRDALAGRGAPGEADRLRGEFICLRAQTCVELAECRATAAPAGRCADFCAATVACGASAEGCEADCADRFDTRRQQAALDCVAAAGDCAAIARCAPPAPPPCDLLCGPRAECGADAEACATACDDAHFVRPEGFIEQVACVNASARCSAREACAADPARGDACRAWCGLQVACEGGDEAALLACTVACARDGVPGRDGLIFGAAESCLADTVGGTCEALAACVNVEPDAFCEPFCAEQTRCGIAADDCLAACAADPDDIIDPAVCVLNAVRREAGCADVATCVGFVPDPPATADCVDLCGAQNRCDEALDRFLCERQCSPPGPALGVQAACVRRSDCDALGTCLGADGTVPAGCVAACGTVGGCEGLLGDGETAVYADTEACGNDCAAGALLNAPTYGDNIATCLDEASCARDEVLACFVNPRDDCGETLEIIQLCGFGDFVAPNPAQYIVDCNNNLANDPVGTQAAIDCIIDVGGGFNGMPPADPLACFGLIGCFGF